MLTVRGTVAVSMLCSSVASAVWVDDMSLAVVKLTIGVQ